MASKPSVASKSVTATKPVDQLPAEPSTQEVMPDYMRHGPSRGSEQVGVDDLVIPRLEIAQALSPAVDKTHSAYIEGCEVGDIYNSVTRQVYGPKVRVVPVLFKKDWLVWRDRSKGGGFRGTFPMLEDAEKRIAEQEKPDEYEAKDTHQHYVLVLKENGDTEQAVISMGVTTSKGKVSRNWNSLIRLGGGDRFSRSYILMVVDETNNQGQKYKNFAVLPGKWAPIKAYKEAEAIYMGMKSGTIRTVVDDKYDEPATNPASTEY